MNARLVQILLPLTGAPAPEAALHEVVHELTERFGGVTAYTRSPATGLWQTSATTERDVVVMVEVVVDDFDAGWWGSYRRELERRFVQQEIHARALPIARI